MNIKIGAKIQPRGPIVRDWAEAGIGLVTVADVADKTIKVAILSASGTLRFEDWERGHVEMAIDKGWYELRQDEQPGSLKLEHGKYEFYKDSISSTVHCKRYNEEWRGFPGDKAVLALFNFALEMQQDRDALLKRIKP